MFTPNPTRQRGQNPVPRLRVGFVLSISISAVPRNSAAPRPPSSTASACPTHPISANLVEQQIEVSHAQQLIDEFVIEDGRCVEYVLGF